MDGLQQYDFTSHMGDNAGLRMKPRPADPFTGEVSPSDTTEEAYEKLGFYGNLPGRSAELCIREGLLRICLTEGENVPVETTIAIAGQLAARDDVQAIALWVIRPHAENHERGTNYRIIITKDAERYPLGAKV